MTELLVWLPECGPETQWPVLSCAQVPVWSLCDLRELRGKSASVGQHLLGSFVDCSLQHSIAELEVPGEACGQQIHMKNASWFGRGEAVLCGNNLSFSFLPLLLAELPPTLLSAAARIWQQALAQV